jgi:hypothetical protein
VRWLVNRPLAAAIILALTLAVIMTVLLVIGPPGR